jgi:hypothetical protein
MIFTKENARDLLVRRGALIEDLIRLQNDTNNAFIADTTREIFLDTEAFYEVCEALKLEFKVCRRYPEGETGKYLFTSFAYIELFGKQYKLFCIYDLEEGENQNE